MNILILTENFIRGGLETQIATYYNELKKNNNIILAVSNYEDCGILSNADIETGFHFNYDVKISDFIDDVDRLVNIVRKNKIDVMHVHPFFSIYQAMFVAQLTEIKTIYSYHGPVSLTFPLNVFDEILFECAIENSISAISTVSIDGKDSFEKMGCNNVSLIANPINMELYKECKCINNKRWAYISRLDKDNQECLRVLITQLDKLDINELVVFGDGTEKESLRKFSELNTKKSVSFRGYVNNLNEVFLREKYNGIMGICRCAIEGLAMGYPVMLVGNGKNCGVIDDIFFEKLKDKNFTTRRVKEKSVEEINEKLKDVYRNSNKYNLRYLVEKYYDIKNIIENYMHMINQAQGIVKNQDLVNFFRQLKDFNKQLKFHDNYNLFDLVNRNIAPNTKSYIIKNEILNLEFMNRKNVIEKDLISKNCKLEEELNILKQKDDELNRKILNVERKYDEIRNLYRSLCEYSSKLEYNLNYLSKNINSKQILKNDINKITNIFKRK